MAAVSALAAGSAVGASSDNVGWGGFGNTPDRLRHSPLTQVNAGNVSQLGRVFAVDFAKIDPGIKRGQQSYAVEANGKLFVTTGDDNVFAIDATNGTVLWRWKPSDSALFKNFGIVANRGVALCDGRLFLTALDMTLVALDPNTGKLLQQVPIAKAVPGASPNYGYSETSVPTCADHRVVVGASGSEYGVRGFVMAYNASDLSPAWPGPFWTIPPAGTSWRRLSRIVGGGVVWTPQTIDTKTNTLYFGTGSATPLYYPDLRPGDNARADSLIAVDLTTGKMKWWQQQMASNEWSYDTSQPPLVYDGKVGGKTRHIVSVGTMEGVWFAYDADTGQPIYERVKVIDRAEHPSLKPGVPVAVFPSSLGGLNFSPASYDPKTDYILNAAAETAVVMVQDKLTPEQRRRKLVLGDVFLGLENGNFGSVLPGWRDHGSISAIDVNTGRQVWKFTTPEPERGGVATTDSGLGFAGGGDGVLRAFDVKTGKILWTFQTGYQIASGASIYSVNGKEYIAITVGGTPTSSGGGLAASQLQVFALGGSTAQSPPPKIPAETLTGVPASAAAAASRATAAVERPAATRRASVQTALGPARILTPSGLFVKPWDANSSNWQDASGQVLLGTTPVAGAKVSVDGYKIPQPTGKDGSFTYPVDITVTGRHAATVSDASHATANGKALTDAEQAALKSASGGFSVGYRIDNLRAVVQKDGNVLVAGHLADTAGNAPPPVALYTYQLQGTITDAQGKPVAGAVVVTRTQDRNFWTFSSPSDAQGHYASFFAASDESGANPVPLTVQVAVGDVTYASPFGKNVNFTALESAQMNIKLPASGALALPQSTSYVGAVYQGLVVGASGPGGVVKPLAERWPDEKGNFSMVLPSALRGRRVTLWENMRTNFSKASQYARGLVDLTTWPSALGRQVPTGIAAIVLPK